MPIFEYYCPKCNFRFEKLVKPAKRDKVISCPHCRSRRTSKLFSTFGFKSNNTFVSSGKTCAGCYSSNCSSSR